MISSTILCMVVVCLGEVKGDASTRRRLGGRKGFTITAQEKKEVAAEKPDVDARARACRNLKTGQRTSPKPWVTRVAGSDREFSEFRFCTNDDEKTQTVLTEDEMYFRDQVCHRIKPIFLNEEIRAELDEAIERNGGVITEENRDHRSSECIKHILKLEEKDKQYAVDLTRRIMDLNGMHNVDANEDLVGEVRVFDQKWILDEKMSQSGHPKNINGVQSFHTDAEAGGPWKYVFLVYLDLENYEDTNKAGTLFTLPELNAHQYCNKSFQVPATINAGVVWQDCHVRHAGPSAKADDVKKGYVRRRFFSIALRFSPGETLPARLNMDPNKFDLTKPVTAFGQTRRWRLQQMKQKIQAINDVRLTPENIVQLTIRSKKKTRRTSGRGKMKREVVHRCFNISSKEGVSVACTGRSSDDERYPETDPKDQSVCPM